MITIDEKRFRERLALIRTSKNISARELSLRLGQSEGYINAIETGKSMPSLKMLFYICEELRISLSDFFDEGNKSPVLLTEIVKEGRRLNDKSLASILAIMKNI